MGFQLPTADELRDGAVEHERIEEIDVVRHEEAGAVGVEAWSALSLHASAGKKGDAAAKPALEPVVFAHIEEDSEKNERGSNDEKMQAAENPHKRAAKDKQGPFHT